MLWSKLIAIATVPLIERISTVEDLTIGTSITFSSLQCTPLLLVALRMCHKFLSEFSVQKQVQGPMLFLREIAEGQGVVVLSTLVIHHLRRNG
jgi:hypothetical protein